LKRMRHVFAESIIGTTGMLQESLILNWENIVKSMTWKMAVFWVVAPSSLVEV
jgi:hypothetical protein